MIIPLQFTQDPILPHLGRALDASIMREIFQQEMFKGGGSSQPTIETCEIFHTRYKRERYCMVAYRLTIRKSPSSPPCEQILCARMVEPGGTTSRFRKAQSQNLVTPRFGEPLFLLTALNMVVWAFPNDRKLIGLPRLMDQIYLRHVVTPKLVQNYPANQWEIKEVMPHLVHYVGEHTCTIRLSVTLSSRMTQETQECTYFGKTYYNQEGESAYQAMCELQQDLLQATHPLVMAAPLWYDQDSRTLWQRGLEGQTLLEHQLDSSKGQKLLHHAGYAVATLHRTRIPCIPSHDMESQLTILDRAHTLIGEVLPYVKSQLAHTVTRLRSGAPPEALQPQVTLHGDLHLKNFFVTGESVTCIDLDNLRTGSPYWDIGSALSNLYYHALVRNEDSSLGSLRGERFLSAYETRIPWPLSRQTLAWHVAFSLITERAYRCGTRLKAGRLDLVPQLLSLADVISRQTHPFYQGTHGPDPSHLTHQGSPTIQERQS